MQFAVVRLQPSITAGRERSTAQTSLCVGGFGNYALAIVAEEAKKQKTVFKLLKQAVVGNSRNLSNKIFIRECSGNNSSGW